MQQEIALREIAFKYKLEGFFKKRVELKIKNNSSVFLRLSERKDQVRITLHKGFLNAPSDIFQALEEFILKKKKEHLKVLRAYISCYLQKNRPECRPLVLKGANYDLKKIFDQNNEKYFKNAISDLNISWFRRPSYRKFSSITFGSYQRKFNLITINQILDSPLVPEYFLSFIVYHEMLHHLIPISIDEKGRRMIHFKRFKEEEKKHEHYLAAKSFKKTFLKKRKIYGWS
jgi:hypothetical protein